MDGRHGLAGGHIHEADGVLADGKTIQPTGKAYRIPMATIGHWNKQGIMFEEFLFWDNGEFMKQIGGHAVMNLIVGDFEARRSSMLSVRIVRLLRPRAIGR